MPPGTRRLRTTEQRSADMDPHSVTPSVQPDHQRVAAAMKAAKARQIQADASVAHGGTAVCSHPAVPGQGPPCPSDRRVTYAVLTEAGLAKLHEASETHLADIRAFFESRFSTEELAQLVALLDRLPAAEHAGEDCSPG